MCGSSLLLLYYVVCQWLQKNRWMISLLVLRYQLIITFFVVIPLLQLDGWAHTYNTLHYITAFGSHVTTPCFILYHLHWL